MIARTCTCGTPIVCADLYGWDVWLDQQPDGGTIDVVAGRAVVTGNGTHQRHTCAETAEPDRPAEPAQKPAEDLTARNERRRREASERAIAAIRIIREHSITLEPAVAAVAAARVQHPDKTYRQLAAIAHVGESTVNRAMSAISTEARHVQQLTGAAQ